MRVLYVTETLGKGGTEKQLSLMADRLRLFGYDAAVLALSSGGWWASYLRDRNISVSTLDFLFTTVWRPRTWGEFSKLISTIRRHKPDVVVSFLYSCSIWVSLAARLAGVPVVVVSRRDCGFQRAEAPLPRWLEMLSYSATTVFVANSRAVAQSLQECEGIRSVKTKVIHNGVDLPVINGRDRSALRKQLGLDHAQSVVGMVANFWPHKNHLMLVHAAKQAVAQHPNIVFVLAGSYWDYQRQVEAVIATFNLEAHFRMVGPMDNMADLLPVFDIGVLCSDSEGFSNTILEYMAYGKPVIATRVGGNSEAVSESETGYLVDRGDAAGLARALLRLLSDPGKLAEMGWQGRARAEAEFNWDKALRRWDQLFQAALSREREVGCQVETQERSPGRYGK